MSHIGADTFDWSLEVTLGLISTFGVLSCWLSRGRLCLRRTNNQAFCSCSFFSLVFLFPSCHVFCRQIARNCLACSFLGARSQLGLACSQLLLDILPLAAPHLWFPPPLHSIQGRISPVSFFVFVKSRKTCECIVHDVPFGHGINIRIFVFVFWVLTCDVIMCAEYQIFSFPNIFIFKPIIPVVANSCVPPYVYSGNGVKIQINK